MVRIAVCDDDPEAADLHRQITAECLRQLECPGEISVYTDSKTLMWDITEDQFFFDLLLLDIEMPGITGMDLPEKIRPYLPEVKIIFITSHLEYAIDAFELSVFRYVPKDELEKRLPGAVRDAVKLIELEGDRTYTICVRGRMERIPYRDIYEIRRDGKNAVITAGSGVAKVRKSLQQVYEELSAEEFIYIDRGCIVNMVHIMQVRDGTVVLENGAVLSVSRSHLQEVKEAVNRWWGNHI